MFDTDVLIAGAGPAGLSLAIELGMRGIRCVVVDPRSEIDPHPRASLLGARSMEFFRRHGLARPILEAGIPPSHRYEVRFITRLNGRLLQHYQSPSPDEYGEMHRGLRTPTPDSVWSPYFKVQIGQHAIEPFLRRRAASFPSVQTRLGWSLVSFEQDDDAVRATISDADGRQERIRARYLAACDGSRSVVRRQLDIPYVGRGAIGQNRSYLFHAPKLMEVARTGRANLHFVFQPGVYGVIIDIDGKGLYNYSHFAPGEWDGLADGETVIRSAVGCEVEFKILRTMDWAHHQSVADRFCSGRAFLLGDAAHLFCPSGGIGMNTAIADAFDLGWKLAARIQGWGGEGLLDSYELERRPIAMRNTIFGADNRDRIDSIMQTLPADLESDAPAAQAARERLVPRFKWLARQFSSMGAHLGARYIGSPIVVEDGSPEPPDDPRIVVQSTWPGCRAPHAWLGEDRSTLDFYDGMGFVLVESGAADGEAAPLAQAAERMGVPLRRVALSDPAAIALYERKFVLVRPDGHVCWRGQALPAQPDELLRIVTGR